METNLNHKKFCDPKNGDIVLVKQPFLVNKFIKQELVDCKTTIKNEHWIYAGTGVTPTNKKSKIFHYVFLEISNYDCWTAISTISPDDWFKKYIKQ